MNASSTVYACRGTPLIGLEGCTLVIGATMEHSILLSLMSLRNIPVARTRSTNKHVQTINRKTHVPLLYPRTGRTTSNTVGVGIHVSVSNFI